MERFETFCLNKVLEALNKKTQVQVAKDFIAEASIQYKMQCRKKIPPPKMERKLQIESK